MSRITLHRWGKKPQPADEESGQGPASRPAPRKGRKRWLLLPVVVMLAAVLWLLPGIVAHTALLDWALQTATADLDGSLAVRSASLGWLRPIVVEGIEVRDVEDRRVLNAEKFASSKPLAEILLNLSSPGRFLIEKPILNVVLRDDGSNIEDLLAEYLKPREEPPPRLDIELRIVDGAVSLTDQTTGRTCQIENLAFTLSTSADGSKPTMLEASADVIDKNRPGRLAVKLSMQQPDDKDQATLPNGEATVTADDVPLEVFTPLLARFVPQTQLAGRLSAQMHADFGEQIAMRATLSAEELLLATPALGNDSLRLDRLNATCEVVYRNDRLEIAPSSLECELGNVSASGVLDLGATSKNDLAEAALHQTFQLEGRIDLARLARMFPTVLRIREQTTITAGQVQLAVVSRPNPQATEPDAMVWQARLEVSDLAAIDNGRQLSWPQPIRITLAAHQTPQGPVVDELKCLSDFLQVHAAGTPDNLVASINFNLKQLADQLGRFVDLDALQLAGNGWGNINWKRDDKQRFEADAELQIRDLQLAAAEGAPWREENIVLLLSAAGRTDLGADTRLDSALLNCRIGEERIEAKLIGPVVDLHRGGSWPVELKLNGKLQNWPPRIRSIYTLDDWTFAGTYDLAAKATGSVDGVTVQQAKLTIAELKIIGQGVNVSEPNVELVCSGRWDQNRRLLHLQPATLSAGSIAIDAKNVVITLPEDQQPTVQFDGQVHYDMEHIVALLRSQLGPGVRIAGKGTSPVSYRGPLDPAKAEAHATFDWDWADLYGCRVGPGTLQARLSGGVLQIEPLDLAVSGGKLFLAPNVRLAPEPMTLTMPPGPLAQRVQITPQMCGELLKFVAPMMAGVTSAQGAFSVELESCRIPLGEPALGDISGKFVIHSIQIGPGPMVRELGMLLGRATTAALRRESVVTFRMKDGRVYHDNLELVFPDLAIRTHGSVGLDQTLNVIAEVTISPKWLGNNQLTELLISSLRNRTIRIPIGGTLSKPKLDQRVLAEFSRQAVENAARNVLQDELQKGLDRLFAPPRR